VYTCQQEILLSQTDRASAVQTMYHSLHGIVPANKIMVGVIFESSESSQMPQPIFKLAI